MPWEEISKDVKRWIEPERMPVRAEWKDPSSLPLSAVLVWLDHFAGCQDGTIPPANKFQFCRVIAGVHPIAPERSQESSRELVRRANKDTWVLTFNDTVTLCHQPTGMKYSDASKAYAEFITTGNYALSSPPDELADSTNTPNGTIDGDAQESTDQATVPSTSALPDSPAPTQPSQSTTTQKVRPKMKKVRATTSIDNEAEPSTDQPVAPISAATIPPSAPASTQPSKSRKALPKTKKAARPSKSRGSDWEDRDEDMGWPSDSEGEDDVDYEKLDTGVDSDGLSSIDAEQNDTGILGQNDEWDDEVHALPGAYLFKYHYVLALQLMLQLLLPQTR